MIKRLPIIAFGLLLGLIFGGYRKGTRIDSGFPLVHSGASTARPVRA